MKNALLLILATIFVPVAISQTPNQKISIDVSGAEALINVFDAMQHGESSQQIDVLLDKALALNPYLVSAERFTAKDQNSPVTLEEYRNYIKSLSTDSVDDRGNRRLAFLKPRYIDAYQNLSVYKNLIEQVKSLSKEDIDNMLKQATDWLPNDVKVNAELLVMFDIGGAAWAYRASDAKDYIMFSVLFLLDEDGTFSKEMFLKTVSHEIHHVGIPLNDFITKVDYENLPDTSRLKLYVDFIAGIIKEGMAQKFCSNAPCKFTEKPYPDEIYAAIPKAVENWDYFISDFGAINDSAKTMISEIALNKIVNIENFYERYANYWTWKSGTVENKEIVLGRRYYYGSEVLGLINSALGKEPLFEIMYDFRKFPYYFNVALKKAKPENFENYLFDEVVVDEILNLK